MEKRLLKHIIPVFIAVTLSNYFLLNKDWAKSIFAGVFFTVFWTVIMYYFFNWWEKKAKEQSKQP